MFKQCPRCKIVIDDSYTKCPNCGMNFSSQNINEIPVNENYKYASAQVDDCDDYDGIEEKGKKSKSIGSKILLAIINICIVIICIVFIVISILANGGFGGNNTKTFTYRSSDGATVQIVMDFKSGSYSYNGSAYYTTAQFGFFVPGSTYGCNGAFYERAVINGWTIYSVTNFPVGLGFGYLYLNSDKTVLRVYLVPDSTLFYYDFVC